MLVAGMAAAEMTFKVVEEVEIGKVATVAVAASMEAVFDKAGGVTERAVKTGACAELSRPRVLRILAVSEISTPMSLSSLSILSVSMSAKNAKVSNLSLSSLSLLCAKLEGSLVEKSWSLKKEKIALTLGR